MWNHENKRAAVVVAHPDDAEIGCFGTMLRLRDAGFEVWLVIVGTGERGISLEDRASLGTSFEQTLRLRESVRAFEGTGVTVESLLLEDGSLQVGIELISVIERRLKAIGPSVVITHHIDHQGLDHQDHAAVARSTLNATVRIPTLRTLLASEPHLSRVDFDPDVFVDITAHHPRKIEALSRHESQAGRVYLSPRYHENRGLRNAHKAGTWFMEQDRRFEAFVSLLQVL